MTKTSKTLVFFGNEKLASGVTTDAPILSGLIEAGYDIAFVAVNQAESHGRSSKKLEVIELAEKNNIEVKYVSKVSDLADDINNSEASFGVLAAFGRIIPQSIIDLFEFGILNIHPSLLPEFRGSTPIESALLSGQEMTGVSLMRLSAGMDEGPVYGFTEVKIEPDMSKQSLYEQLSSAGSAMLLELLPQILSGEINTLEQDHDQASYTKLLSKESGVIDWTKSDEEISCEVRAYLGWPGSQTTIAGKDVIITEAKPTDGSGEAGKAFNITKSQFGIYCGQGALEILKIKPAGKAEMSSQAFLAGNKIS